MAGSSLFGKVIDYDPAEHAANEAVDTLQSRVIASNVAHLADASAQVLVAHPPNAAASGFARTYSASGSLFVLHATFGPFFPRARSDGRTYAVRYRLHGASDKATNGIEFAVWLHPYGTAPAGIGRAVDAFEASAGNPAVQIHTTSSTTPAWVAPDAGSPLLRMTARDTRGARAPLGVRDEIGGASLGTLPTWSAISVFSRRATGSAATGAELTGFYAAEYYA
jgi:hypothetical protein